jgi:dTDP-4-dehydrorhamnose reductase
VKVLIPGAFGQLGRELARAAPAEAKLTLLDLPEFDVGDREAVREAVEAAGPDLIINTAAYTAVDQAESEPEAAARVNADGPAALAQAALDAGARLIHVSTDFVFDGRQGRPYLPDDPPRPLGAYGQSKWDGEQAVTAILGDAALIVRTAWLYSAHGRNFVKSILRLLAERDRLTVIADQVGTPTWARSLAGALWRAADLGVVGLHHYTDAGVASWYDLAAAAQEEALALGLLTAPKPILPITAADYPLPAPRPSYSVLDKTAFWAALGGPAPHWRQNLRAMLGELKG